MKLAKTVRTNGAVKPTSTKAAKPQGLDFLYQPKIKKLNSESLTSEQIVSSMRKLHDDVEGLLFRGEWQRVAHFGQFGMTEELEVHNPGGYLRVTGKGESNFVTLGASVEWYRNSLSSDWWKDFQHYGPAFDLWLGMIAGIAKANREQK